MHINKRLLLIGGIAFFLALVFGPRIETGKEAAVVYQASSFINTSDVGCSQKSDAIHCDELPLSVSGSCDILNDSHIIKLKDGYFSGQCRLNFSRSSFPADWKEGEICKESSSEVTCDTSLYKELAFQGLSEKLSTRFVSSKDDSQYEERKISEVQSVWNDASGRVVFSLGDTQYLYDEGYFVKSGAPLSPPQIPEFSSCVSLEGEDLKSSSACLENSTNAIVWKKGEYYHLLESEAENYYSYKAKESSSGSGLNRWSSQFLKLESPSNASQNPEFRIKYPVSAIYSSRNIFPTAYAADIISPPVFHLQFAQVDSQDGSIKKSSTLIAEKYNIIQSSASDYEVLSQLKKADWDKVVQDINPNAWRILHHEHEAGNTKYSEWASLQSRNIQVDSNLQLISPSQDKSILKDFKSLHTQDISNNVLALDMGAVIQNKVEFFRSSDSLKGIFIFGGKEMILSQDDIYYPLENFLEKGSEILQPQCENILFDVRDNNDVSLTRSNVYRGFSGTFALSSFDNGNIFSQVEWSVKSDKENVAESDLVEMTAISLLKESFQVKTNVDEDIKKLIVNSDITLKNNEECHLTKSLILKDGLGVGIDKVHVFIEP